MAGDVQVTGAAGPGAVGLAAAAWSGRRGEGRRRGAGLAGGAAAWAGRGPLGVGEARRARLWARGCAALNGRLGRAPGRAAGRGAELGARASGPRRQTATSGGYGSAAPEVAGGLEQAGARAQAGPSARRRGSATDARVRETVEGGAPGREAGSRRWEGEETAARRGGRLAAGGGRERRRRLEPAAGRRSVVWDRRLKKKT
jgi:hypothetical protein